MKTKVIRMNPQELDMEGIREAGEILRQGGLVAFPTETVYGLGAVSYTHLETLVKLHLDNKGKDYIEFEYQKSVQRFNRFLDEVMNMNVWKYIDKYNNIFMQENL